MFDRFATRFPLHEPSYQGDIKDPCLIHADGCWHIFGTRGSAENRDRWGTYHISAPALEGPWTKHGTIYLPVEGSGVVAPGVIWQDGVFLLFVQTEFNRLGGRIVYASSRDGDDWDVQGVALLSLPGTSEAGIYDPHPALLRGVPHLVYSGFPDALGMVQPDLYLAQSLDGTWADPWTRLGRILDHIDLEHHNQLDHPDYEWGIEGGQLADLPDGRILLMAVCFLPQGSRGSRQRAFLTVADDLVGPYTTLGP